MKLAKLELCKVRQKPKSAKVTSFHLKLQYFKLATTRGTCILERIGPSTSCTGCFKIGFTVKVISEDSKMFRKQLDFVLLQGVRKLDRPRSGFLGTLEITFYVASRFKLPFNDLKTDFNVSGCFGN